MYSKETIVKNATGIHARPASLFVKCAKDFSSDIKITNMNSGKEASVKSMIAVMTLQLSKETPIKISAEGEDEVVAVDTLIKFIDDGCGE